VPLVKFMATSALLGGGAAVAIGDVGEEYLTRKLFGQAVHIPGVPEMLFGVSLGHQLGMGSIGADDLGSFLFYLPGPTVGYIQGLLGWTTGVSAGQGLDLSQAGRELTTQERLSLLNSTMLPGGLQLNRVINALRLVQNDGQYRKALDLSEALGLQPSQGDLLSQRAATLEELLLGAVGAPPAHREIERRTTERQLQMQEAISAAQKKAASFLAAGQFGEAQRVMDKVNASWKDQMPIPAPLPTANAINDAVVRRLLPPGVLRKPPAGPYVFAEPFRLGGMPTLFEENP